jgi:nicotinic acid mononucleotide adenylyltransferase
MVSECLNLFGKKNKKADFTLDEVWIVPCGNRPDKPNDLPPETRLLMTELAVKDTFQKGEPVKIDKCEVENGRFIETIYLMERF